MSGLRASIQAIVESGREQEWQRAGISDVDIRLSRLSGMDARDIRALREFSSRRFLIVVRCPKETARVWHGVLPGKPMYTKQKTGSSGVVVTPEGRMFVSDYDLMSIWRRGRGGFEKVFVSAANGAVHGRWPSEAMAIVVELNKLLVTRIQHGCQDDFHSPRNPGIKPTDRFAAFCDGAAQFLPGPAACADFYAQNKLDWPYSADGLYTGPGA